ncbi:MAG: cytidine deaminase [Anaerolineae bacterium]|nr:cytidine deaminase [Anaerolineae bacterium]MDW8171288.1 cytidine deaminase [Anaerolineae bacterium]
MTPQETQALIEQAIAAAQYAYIPYSRYAVGAALLAKGGQRYSGCNVENAAYPACICAERTALVKAISEGQRHFVAIAVATRDGGSPCGLCRQMLFEFAPDLRVLICDFAGKVHHDLPLRALLAHGFGPERLLEGA